MDNNVEKIDNTKNIKDNNQNLQFNGIFDSIESNNKNDLNNKCDEFINIAFELKSNKDYQGAINNFMYALESGPSTEIVFWIILDICVLYKQLGQSDLAKEVLKSYHSKFKDIMSEEVMREIENNL